MQSTITCRLATPSILLKFTLPQNASYGKLIQEIHIVIHTVHPAKTNISDQNNGNHIKTHLTASTAQAKLNFSLQFTFCAHVLSG